MLTALVMLLRTIGRMCWGHRAVALENLALRQQLATFTRTRKRPQLRTRDRLFWILLAQGWHEWRTALMIVQPDTVALASGMAPSPVGRPLKALSPRPPEDDWRDSRTRRQDGLGKSALGCSRIHGELSKLGIALSQRTVSRLLHRRRRPPSQTWRTFLANHTAALVSMDFFTVPTFTGRVLFVFVLLAHQRRRVVHFGITEHPTAMWTAQQIIEAFPDDTAPRWVLRDRDAIYGDVFQHRVASMGMMEVISSPSRPWQNPYAERLIGSIRRECLDHVIIFNQRHLRHTLARYVFYYHGSRTHLSLAKDAPTPRPVQAPEDGRVIALLEVGGLHHRYERRAA